MAEKCSCIFGMTAIPGGQMRTEAMGVKQAFTKRSFVRSSTALICDERLDPLAGTRAVTGIFMVKALSKSH